MLRRGRANEFDGCHPQLLPKQKVGILERAAPRENVKELLFSRRCGSTKPISKTEDAQALFVVQGRCERHVAENDRHAQRAATSCCIEIVLQIASLDNSADARKLVSRAISQQVDASVGGAITPSNIRAVLSAALPSVRSLGPDVWEFIETTFCDNLRHKASLERARRQSVSSSSAG